MESGKVTVQDDHVIFVEKSPVETGSSVKGHVDGEPALLKPALYRLGECPLVFDNQHTHSVIIAYLTCPLAPSATSAVETSATSYWVGGGGVAWSGPLPDPGPGRGGCA